MSSITFLQPQPAKPEQSLSFPSGPGAEEYFSGHVVPDNPYYRKLVESGLTCPLCSQQFRIVLWPHNEVIAECGCRCACHRPPRR